jgi:predicted HTH domain antitoxin
LGDEEMGQTVVTVRIDPRLLEELDEVAKKEKTDRASLLRKILVEGLERYKMEMAIDMYKDGKLSTEKAAQTAGVSVYEMIERLRREGVPTHLTLEEIREETVGLLKRIGREDLVAKVKA